MENVLIQILNDDSTYFALLTTLNNSSPIDILKQTENVFVTSGRVLVDNILHSGNNSDRFMELQYSDGKFDFDTAQYVQIDRKNTLRIEANNALRGYPSVVNNSILNSAQKKLLLHGISI